MFAQFSDKDDFFDQYIYNLAVRMAYCSLEMESNNVNVSTTKSTIEIYNNIKAFVKLIKDNKERLSPYDIAAIADIINKDLNYFSNGFRKVQVEVKKAQYFFPVPACEVIPRMYSLMDNYYNVWNILPIYEKEAKLHIELVRLQPFEDGNKRTSCILTNYNLCKQSKAPIVISGDEIDKYFNFIDRYDVDGFTEFLTEKSKKELEIMLNFYQAIYDTDSFIESNKEGNVFTKILAKGQK